MTRVEEISLGLGCLPTLTESKKEGGGAGGLQRKTKEVEQETVRR